MDGSNYNSDMKQLWKQFSPRLSASYNLTDQWSLSANAGLYYQLPPYTSMGYKDNDGAYVNKQLKYMQVGETALGVDWHLQDRFMVSVEGFFKRYGQIPYSLTDDIPLLCKGNDYGVVGNEALTSTAQGRAYGVETMFRWQVPGRFNVVSSFTLFKSEYRNGQNDAYIPSAWDNRFILNLSGTYNLPRRWSVGLRLSCIGGSPYTPYDETASSYKTYWDAHGRSAYDYNRYNACRLPGYAQLDVRVDKEFYFKNWRLGLYIDLQNVTVSKLRQQDVFMSTGIVENPEAALSEQRYKMRHIKQVSGTLLPTIGLTVEL